MEQKSRQGWATENIAGTRVDENGTLVYQIAEHVKSQPIEWLFESKGYEIPNGEEVLARLRKLNCKTVGDVLAKKKRIPKKYMVPIKRKLIFNN